jgi:hypothetical protein
MFYDILCNDNSREEIKQWIDDSGSKMWYRFLFSAPRYGILSSKPVEVLYFSY